MSKGNRIKQSRIPMNPATMQLLQVIRNFAARTRSIIPHAEKLALELTPPLLDAVEGAIWSHHVAVLKRLENLQADMSETEKNTVDRCIQEINRPAGSMNVPEQRTEELAPGNGDGTEPNE